MTVQLVLLAQLGLETWVTGSNPFKAAVMSFSVPFSGTALFELVLPLAHCMYVRCFYGWCLQQFNCVDRIV